MRSVLLPFAFLLAAACGPGPDPADGVPPPVNNVAVEEPILQVATASQGMDGEESDQDGQDSEPVYDYTCGGIIVRRCGVGDVTVDFSGATVDARDGHTLDPAHLTRVMEAETDVIPSDAYDVYCNRSRAWSYSRNGLAPLSDTSFLFTGVPERPDDIFAIAEGHVVMVSFQSVPVDDEVLVVLTPDAAGPSTVTVE